MDRKLSSGEFRAINIRASLMYFAPYQSVRPAPTQHSTSPAVCTPKLIQGALGRTALPEARNDPRTISKPTNPHADHSNQTKKPATEQSKIRHDTGQQHTRELTQIVKNDQPLDRKVRESTRTGTRPQDASDASRRSSPNKRKGGTTKPLGRTKETDRETRVRATHQGGNE